MSDTPQKTDMLRYQQTKLGIKHTFFLDKEKITFSYNDRRGSGEFSLDYAELPLRHITVIEQNEWLTPLSVLSAVACACMLFTSLLLKAPLLNALPWAVFAIGGGLWSMFSKTEYSAWRTEHGVLYIMQDKQHDEIFNTLIRRRKHQLLRWHGDINFNNDLDQEIEKFKWLRKQEVLSKEEFDQKIAQIEKMKHQLDEENSVPARLN